MFCIQTRTPPGKPPSARTAGACTNIDQVMDLLELLYFLVKLQNKRDGHVTWLWIFFFNLRDMKTRVSGIRGQWVKFKDMNMGTAFV